MTHFFLSFAVGSGGGVYAPPRCPDVTGKALKKTDTIRIVIPLPCLIAESLTVDVLRATWDVGGKDMFVSDKSALKDKLALD